jgi:hypothetical protein
MKSFRLASILVAAAAALGLAGGCMPFKFLNADIGTAGSGGESGFGGEGFGGSGSGGADTSTSTGTSTGGVGGEGGATQTPTNLAYLCGGSQATCSPDPGSTDCTPGGSTGMGGAALDAGSSKLTCQIVANGTASEAKCVLVDGLSGENGPCTASTDCSPGLGCGQVGSTGLCHAYCCGDPDACPSGTLCQATPMVKTGEVSIPLCIPVPSCELLSDTPSCPAGQACAIVRTDGTRTCVDVGSGDQTGAACPCAQGFMCSPTTQTCIKLCHIGGASDECGLGTCTGGLSQFPAGIGYCVGGP